MTIFKDYTGNTMLNNALQTIEAMAELDDVSQITPELLLEHFQQRNLPRLYQRMKNFTIIFSRNGPLFNGEASKREATFRNLFETVLQNFESDGPLQCEISGLRFKTTFLDIYFQVLTELGIEPKSRDITLNRTFWPLIGGLGSDAQALPRAKFSIQMHPICLAIMQFLPLSTVLYQGRALLVESVNFDFARFLVSENYKLIAEQIEGHSLQDAVENVKFSKPDYLKFVLENFHDLNRRKPTEEYTDLNFWMFSNSGTGAECKIDRISDEFFRKLHILYANHKNDLFEILNRKDNFVFLECLDANEDYRGLYPLKKWQGVSVHFFETYHKLINNSAHLQLAAYIAGLIDKYKTAKDEKLLKKTDAHRQKEYADFLFPVLIKAARAGEWNVLLHTQILNDADEVPVNKGIHNIFQMVHFYYQASSFRNTLPEIEPVSSAALQVCSFFVELIQNDVQRDRLINNLTDPQNYNKTQLNGLIVRAADNISFEEIYSMLYRDGRRSHFGLLALLRLHFSTQDYPVLSSYKPDGKLFENCSVPQKKLLHKYRSFAENYADYYTARYGQNGTRFPSNHFRQHVIGRFPQSGSRFYYWLNDVATRQHAFSKENQRIDVEILCCDENGENNTAFSRFAIAFFLTKTAFIKQNKSNPERGNNE